MNPLYIVMGIAVLSVAIGSIAAKEPAVFLRLIANGLVGVFAIMVLNRLGAETGFCIGLNPFTLGMISIFGIPGFVSVAALAYFL
ncbi:MAG: pro-sigmaK processing inhibitor BofA family protein [Firmicutes bacterium]|nr:pro-sigmaK processing inhibitor BofA family protein [Bacillota bacterium]